MARSKVRRSLGALALSAASLLALTAPAGAGVDVSADIGVSWTDGALTQIPGTTGVFTLVVTNTGPDAAAPEVAPTFDVGTVTTWSCAVTGGATCASGVQNGAVVDFTVMPINSSITYTINVAIPASATGNITGTVSTPTVFDPNANNNAAADVDALTPQADGSITKTDGVSAVRPGDEVTYEIVAGNAGPSDTTATVTDTVPASLLDPSWTCVSSGGASCPASSGTGNLSESGIDLPVDGEVTYFVTATVSPTLDAGDSFVNTAFVAANSASDEETGNDDASDQDQVVDNSADLVASKSAPAQATVGGTITYTLGIRNDGPDPSFEALLEDTIPTGTTFVSFTQLTGPTADLSSPPVGSGGGVEAGFAVLDDGASATFSLVVQLDANIAAGSTISNTASVTTLDDPDQVQETGLAEVAPAATVDPTIENNTASASTSIVAVQVTTTSTTGTTVATTTTASVRSGALARTGGDADGPTGLALIVLGAGLVLVGAAELRRRSATMG